MSDKLKETVGPVAGPGDAANEAGRRVLKGVTPNFASDDAAEAWFAAGSPPLPAQGSGKGGAYTKADVKTAADSKEA